MPHESRLNFSTDEILANVPTREALLSSSGQPFDWVESGQLKVNIGQRYPLRSMHAGPGHAGVSVDIRLAESHRSSD